MDDSGAACASDRRELADPVQQRVHQGTPGVTWCRVNDHPGRLVDDEKPLVLKQHVHRNVLRLGDRWFRWWHLDHDRLASFRNVALLRHAIGNANAARFDQKRSMRAREGELLGKIAVEPLPGRLIDLDVIDYESVRPLSSLYSCHGRDAGPPPRARPGAAPRRS